MKCSLLVIILYGALVSALPISPETKTGETDLEFAKKYMQKYYPESEQTPVVKGRSTNTALLYGSIRKMQAFFGLNVTGKLDSNTLDVMKKPRCGVPDTGEFNHFPYSPAWKKNALTYSIQNYTPDMARNDVDKAIERAWKVWSDVTPLTFSRVYENSADIVISFASGNHGDFDPFDGPGGTLAHAFSPAFGGNAHFDEDEYWSKNSQGTNLFLVAAHEFGHSLGLRHSSVYESLMFPNYQPWQVTNFKLHTDDINGIQALYGPREDGSLKAPSTEQCDHHLAFDAVTSLRGETLFFKDSSLWRKNPLSRDVEKDPISAFWPAFKNGIDAAYEVEDKDTMFVFKGHKYWATKATFIQPGFPKNIHSLGFPKTVKKVDAAVYDRNSKKTLFFSGTEYWRYDERKKAMEKGYTRKTKTDFPEVGSKVDAAFQQDGHLYLFSGSKQYEFDSQNNTFLNVKQSNSWFGCK